ncbi:hypothetical protein Tco_1118656 [Tanacetum coccineum]
MYTSATHNAIMEAGGKDLSPMLVVGNYVQWRSRIRRYIATRPNHDLINHCIYNGPYQFKMMDHPTKEAISISKAQPARRGLEKYSYVSPEKQNLIDVEAEAVYIILTRIDNDIYSTLDFCANSKEMWLAIERLMQGENINKYDVETNLFWAFEKFTSQDGQDLKNVSYHKLLEILKQHHNEVNDIRAEILARQMMVMGSEAFVLRYQIEEYTKDIVHDFEQRLDTVFGRQGQELFTSYAWRRLFEIQGPLVQEFMLEFFSTCKMSDTELMLDEADTLWAAPSYTFIQDHVRRLSHRLISYTIFSRGQAPEKVTGIDLFYLRSMDQGTANVPYLLALYLFKHTKRRKSIARMFEGYFIGRLAEHFGLVSDEGLMGLSVIVRMIPVIDLDELVAEGAPDIDEGAQAIPALVQVPQLPPATIQTRTMPQSIARLEEEVHGIQESLAEQQEVMETMARDFFQRRMVRRRTSEANTSAVSLNEDQPDP